jgi:hypothetical protein
MHTLRRRSSRRRCYRAAKIQLRGGTWARDCLVTDISDVGVRLNAEGLDVPDEFVLLLSTDGVVRQSTCKVVWRRGDEVEIACQVCNSSSKALASIKTSVSKSCL